MIWSVLLFDLVPLIAFAVLDALGNVRYALIGAIIAALLNLLYSQFFLYFLTPHLYKVLLHLILVY